MRNKRFLAICLSSAMIMSALAGCSASESSETKADLGEKPTHETTASDTDASTEGTTGAPEETYAPSSIDITEIDYSKYVDVSDWKNTVVKAEDVIEDDYNINFGIIDDLVSNLGFERKEIKDRPVQAGDIAVIDFEGFIDGEELENGSGKDFELTIGSNSFIAGFEQGIVGMEVGDNKTLELSFPDPYPNNPEIAGSPVEFKVTVNAIKGIDTASITDEQMVEACKKLENSERSYSSYEEYEKEYKETRAKAYREKFVWNSVVQSAKKLDVCQELVDDFINTYLYSFSMYAQYFQISVSDYIKYFGYSSVEEFKKDILPTAEEYANQSCIVLAIADKEGISYDEEKLEEKYQEALKEHDGDEKALEESGYGKASIKFDLLLEAVENYVYDTIEVK